MFVGVFPTHAFRYYFTAIAFQTFRTVALAAVVRVWIAAVLTGRPRGVALI